MEIYSYPREKWDDNKCKQFESRKDGMIPFPGEIHCSGSVCSVGHTQLYNGGIIIEGKHYSGVFKPLPEISHNYRWVSKISWGIFLRNVNNLGKYDEVLTVDKNGRILA
jgi:hypothetical protein